MFLPALTDSHDHWFTCSPFFPLIYLPLLLLVYSPAHTPSHFTCPHFFPRTFLPALTYFQRPFVEHRTPESLVTLWHRVRQAPPLDPECICFYLYLSTCLSIYLSIYIFLSIYRSTSIYLYLSIYLSIYVYIEWTPPLIRTPGSQAMSWHRVRQTPPLDPETCGPISPHSGRDCVKSLRSSCTGLYPQMNGHLHLPRTPPLNVDTSTERGRLYLMWTPSFNVDASTAQDPGEPGNIVAPFSVDEERDVDKVATPSFCFTVRCF